ncbi:MAG: RagB/SusD family nutrient uptake outer membrane protein [Paludibacteraceae bacterium]
MKKVKYIIIAVLILSMTFTACSGFLEEDNKVGQTAELVYGTSSGLQGLVASCYSFARGWYGKEAGLGLSEAGTDLFYYGYDNKQKSLNSYSITAQSLDNNVSDNACLDQYWELFYGAVDACNNAIKYIPLNKVVSDATKNQYLGEVYFLRAFYYLHMVNIWGPIPYNEEPFSEVVTTATRVPEEVVYSKILSDIDKSIEYFQNYKIKTDGHANYWASRALKARTLLYVASWLGKNAISTNAAYSGKDLYSLAKAEAEAVINSGVFSFYDKYADTWSMTNEDFTKNKEAIWGVSYSDNLLTTSNCIPYRYKTSSSGSQLQYNGLITRTGYSRGGSSMLLMFVSMWNNGASDLGGDKKEIFARALADPTYIQNTVTKVNVNVAPYYSSYGRGFTRYLPSVYLWKLLEKNRATDQRTAATLLDVYSIAPGLEGSAKLYTNIKDTAIYYCPLDGDSPEGKAKQTWAKGRYRIQFLSGGDIPVYSSSDPATAKPTEAAKAKSDVYGDARYNTYKIGGWCSYPGIKKFLDNVYDNRYITYDISSRDAVVFRLAEMYLIKAECELATGGDALGTINLLRAKRAISGKDNSISGTVDINTILDERAIELCGEQQRWFDLKRTHTLVARVKAYNAQGATNVADIHYLRPIPQAQLDAVTNKDEFRQNDGY